MTSRLATGALAVVLAVTSASFAGANEPVTLRFAFSPPATSYLNVQGMAPWMEKVEKAAGGTIRIKLFPGYTLATSRNVYERTLADVSQISFGVFGQLPSQFPLVEVGNLPFLSTNTKYSSAALWRVYAKGLFAPEFGKVKVLALFNFNNSALNTNKPITSVNDITGMKLAVSSRLFADLAKALGAAPVTLAVPVIYEAMNRGLVDGVVTSLLAAHTFKIDEVTKDHLLAPLGQAPAYVFMNKTAYAALPAQAKQAIDKYSGEAFSERLGAVNEAAEIRVKNKLAKSSGHTINRLSPKQYAIWKARIQPVIDSWVQRTPGGAKVLATYREEIKSLRAGH